MSWGRSRRRRSPEIASLMENLHALEDTDDFSDPTDLIELTEVAAPEIATSGRSPGLIRWFTAGFASAFVAGGIALLVLLLVHPALARSVSSASASSEPIVQSLIPETRQLWWK